MIAESRHSLLGQRIVWRYEANANQAVAGSERHRSKYDDRSRAVGAINHSGRTPKECFVFQTAENAG